jgi:hypothetical protein
MKEGLLWYDDNPKRDLAEKVERAVRRYRQKFGTPANVCYVHPSTLAGTALLEGVWEVDGVCVAPLPSVLRHHFWVGREEKRQRQRAAKPTRH